MSLPTNRAQGDIIDPADINNIAEAVNALSDDGTSGSGILNVSGTVNLDDTPGIREVYATASATVEGVALAAGDAAVFRYFSGAWTYMVVGQHTTWQLISATPVTANTPTADDTANTITWTPKTGVQYVIGGQVRTPPYSVGDVTTSVTVTAQATAGYTLQGTASWSFNFTGSVATDTTPPTPGTLAVTGTGTTRTLTVTFASDAGSGLHDQPYRFSTNGGTTWSTYQASNVFTTGALTAGTYQPRVMVRDDAGNTATASAADFTVTVPDTTAPTAGTLAASAISETSFTLTVTGAGDNVGLHTQPYDFSTDNGATWLGYQSSNIRNVTGRTGSTTYQARHRVRDAAGNVTTGTAISVTTTAPVPSGPVFYETFTYPNGTTMSGKSSEVGGFVMLYEGWTAGLDAGNANPIVTGNQIVAASGSGMVLGCEPWGDVGKSAAMTSIDYDLSAGGSSRQVRLLINNDSSTDAALYVVKANGTLSKGDTQVATGIPTAGTLRVEKEGTTCRAYIDGVLKHTATTTTSKACRFAWSAFDTGAKVDNWAVDPL